MVARQAGELVALVEDDGRGFDPEGAGAGSGRRSLGLLGMRERVGLVGGTLVVGGIVGFFYSKNSSSLSVKSSQVYDTRDSSGVTPSDHRPVLTVFAVK